MNKANALRIAMLILIIGFSLTATGCQCPSLADVSDSQILAASGGTVGFARLQLGWTYGSGEKPQALSITVYRLEAGQWTNIMPSEQPFAVSSPATTTSADVTIWRLFSGDYRIVFNASYSCNRQAQYTFERKL